MSDKNAPLQDWMKYVEEQEQLVTDGKDNIPLETLPRNETNTSVSRESSSGHQRPASSDPTELKTRESATASSETATARPSTIGTTQTTARPASRQRKETPAASKSTVTKPVSKPRAQNRLNPEMVNGLLEIRRLQHSLPDVESDDGRRDLLNRLLDPVLELRETALLLNVCTATVRRYTDSGLLRHRRTKGNQRRFKLSDILSFLDKHTTESGIMEPQDTDNNIS